MRIKAKDISWSAGRTIIVKPTNLSVESREFVGIVGPNGSGKTSLLHLMARITSPTSGTILIDEKNIWELQQRFFAQLVAVVPQESPHDLLFSVEEIVLMGRIPHKGLFDADTDSDYVMSRDNLNKVGMSGFERRIFSSLSGGEKQRVLIARALTQDPQAILLDEPTNHLDIRYQLEILRLIKSLNITIVAVLHDLNHAANFCDRVILMNQGEIIGEGSPKDILTEKNISDVYGVTAQVEKNQKTKEMRIHFTGLTS